jgi:lysophospholipase L1-like esterase
LLHPDAPRAAQIDGARIAVCREDPDLIPLIYSSFHRAKASYLADDPDVYERLLRALQVFSPATLRAELLDPELGLGGQVHAELSQLAWRRLHHDWLAPLGGEDSPSQPLSGFESPRIINEAGSWLENVLDLGADGLVRLQTDSGDHGYVFLQRLQGWHLSTLIEEGPPAHARLAAEVCRQSALCDGAAREAVKARLLKDREIDLGPIDTLPDFREDPREINTQLRPVTRLQVGPVLDESVVRPARRVSGGSWAAIALFAAWVFWLAALRLGPSRRSVLFPIGAVLLAPTCWLLAEIALATGGLAPLAEVAGHGWSEPQARRGVEESRGFLLKPSTLSGQPHLEVLNNGARWAALPVERDTNSWRIVALGESSVHASNHLRGESFVEVLGSRLRQLHPDKTVEVLNGGVGGAISDDIVLSGFDALAADADLLILYHGINDLGRLETLAGMRAFSPVQLAVRVMLDESRVARVIHDLLPRRKPPGPEDEGAWGDDTELDDVVRQRLRRFGALRCSRNQQRLIRAAQAQNVPVIVVAQALVTDPRYLDIEQERHLLREIAETTAARTGAVLLDGHTILGAHSLASGGPPDPGAAYFWDQLHPSRLGHAVLGEALAPTAQRLLLEKGGR